LAALIEKSLAHNPNGTWKLSGARCGYHGSCATPLDYLRAFQHIDPTAGLASVQDLPVYLRQATSAPGPKGSWQMYCLVPLGNGWTGKSGCLNRVFKSGEHIWISRTGVGILAEDCTNPINGPAKAVAKIDCIELHFTTKPGDPAVRVAVFGPSDNSNVCGPSLHKAGETGFDDGWLDECPDTTCNFAGAQAILQQKILWKASYRPTAGDHYVRLPRSYADKGSPYTVVLCLDHGDGSHSCGIDVHDTDYHNSKARVYYGKQDIPANYKWRKLYWDDPKRNNCVE
jgi:hypothetical protein